MSTGLDLEVQLTVTHGDRPLVDVADVRIEAGRPLTIVGESGSGKSILAHAIMGTIATDLKTEGTLRLRSETYDLAHRNNRRHLWGRELALLPQEPALALDPTMRVRSQVAEGLPASRSDRRRGHRWGDRQARRQARRQSHRLADDALTRLDLAHTATAFPHTLSGGMAQRVAYAAATIGGARFLIVDEPSKGLDRAALDRLADLLAEHVTSGGLLLTITHDLQLARRLGGDVLVMRDASILERGPAEQVLDTPAHDYTRRLLAAEPSRWRYDWQDAPVGPGAPGDPADAGGSDDPLITATGVTKSYGDTELFRDLSLRIGAGQRWALTGPSGVGKTTLGNVLLRLTPIDHGTVHHHSTATGGRLQKLYQDPALSFPARVRLELSMKDVMRRHRIDAARMESLMSAVGLPTELLRRRPDQVSGGELQRLAIVRAMLLEPALIFADEATSRLDLITQERTMDCLMSELTENGCALLLVTHDRELAAAVTDHHLDMSPDGRCLPLRSAACVE